MLRLVCPSKLAARCILCSASNRPSPRPVHSLNKCCRCDSLKLHSRANFSIFCGELDAIICSTLRRWQSWTTGISAPGAKPLHLADPLLASVFTCSGLSEVVLAPLLLAED